MRRVLLIVALLVVAELVALGALVSTWGALPTFLVIVVTSAVGAWLTKVQGVESLRKVRAAVAEGRPPTRELADTALVVTAGLLLLLPGVLSDVVGVLLALPPVRAVAVTWLVGRVRPPAGVRIGTADIRFRTSFGGPTPSPASTPPSWVRHDEVIDLDADEYYVDDPRGELGRGSGPER